MTKRTDLAHWLRYPGNVTGNDLMAEAERRGWELVRVTGDHFMYRKGSLRVSIDRGVKADGTKRSIIKSLQEGG